MNNMNLDFGKLCLIGEDGVPREISEIKEIVEEAEPDDIIIFKPNEPVESNEEQIRHLIMEASFTVDSAYINEPFIRNIENQHKKYLRDKAQYKFWKDQEFAGNNRAGRRRRQK